MGIIKPGRRRDGSGVFTCRWKDSGNISCKKQDSSASAADLTEIQSDCGAVFSCKGEMSADLQM